MFFPMPRKHPGVCKHISQWSDAFKKVGRKGDTFMILPVVREHLVLNLSWAVCIHSQPGYTIDQ
jgi:hypothetical protein